MFPVFDRLEGMSAVRTLELQWSRYFFTIDKGLTADLALKLTAAASVIIDVLMWYTAERADGIRRDITDFTFLWLDGLYGFAMSEPVIFVPELPVLLDEWLDDGQFIGKELLVLGAVEFVMSPLLKRDVSADKKNKPADLLILFLNDSE